jgi:DNA-binding XRE family transcriptional regulator
VIKTKTEYDNLKVQLATEEGRIAEQRLALRAAGLDKKQLQLAMMPLISFSAQLRAEIEFYERILGGDFSGLSSLRSVGRLLIAVRLAAGISQAELARRLGTSSSQVSRDERDEYYGATLEKVGRVFDVLGFEGDVHVIPKGDADVPITA